MSKNKQFLEQTRNKKINGLNKELETRNSKLRDLRFELGFGKVNNLKSIRATKKEIAQILTVIKEKSTKEK